MIDKILRDKILKEISKYLGNKIAIKVEEGIFNFSSEYSENNGTPFLLQQIYETKSEEIVKILEGKTLKFIIDSINNDKIKPERIAFMRKSELIPQLQKEKKVKEKKGSNIFKCEKCKKRNTSITELQIQRADEPATQIVTCLECSHTWML